MKNNKTFTYSGYSIPVSYIMKLRHKRGFSAHKINQFIYWGVQYCDYKGGEVTLIQAIQSGIKKGWIFKLMNSGHLSMSQLHHWCDYHIYGKRKVKTVGGFTPKVDRKALPGSIGDIMKDILST